MVQTVTSETNTTAAQKCSFQRVLTHVALFPAVRRTRPPTGYGEIPPGPTRGHAQGTLRLVRAAVGSANGQQARVPQTAVSTQRRRRRRQRRAVVDADALCAVGPVGGQHGLAHAVAQALDRVARV
jgi:hypothetical protein